MSGQASATTVGRELRRVVAVLALCVYATACGEARDVPTPAPSLAWTDGPPAGDLERDPWVRAAREAENALAASVNAADFSGETLNRRWSEQFVNSFVLESTGRLTRGGAVVYLGPRPFEPLAVIPSADEETAKVAGCTAPLHLREESPTGGLPDDALARVYVLEVGDDGQRRVVSAGRPEDPFFLPSGEPLTDELCRAVEVKSARFEPEPDLDALAAKGRDDLVAP